MNDSRVHFYCLTEADEPGQGELTLSMKYVLLPVSPGCSTTVQLGPTQTKTLVCLTELVGGRTLVEGHVFAWELF